MAEPLFSDVVSEKARDLWSALDMTKPRPWAEFFAVFKPPKKADLEQRLCTNLLHYRANYAWIFLAMMGLAVLLSPRTLLVIVLCGTLSVFIVLGDVKTLVRKVGYRSKSPRALPPIPARATAHRKEELLRRRNIKKK